MTYHYTNVLLPANGATQPLVVEEACNTYDAAWTGFVRSIEVSRGRGYNLVHRLEERWGRGRNRKFRVMLTVETARGGVIAVYGSDLQARRR